jgi:hypothetical protein
MTVPIVERKMVENAVGSKRAMTPEDDRENGGRWLTENARGIINENSSGDPRRKVPNGMLHLARGEATRTTMIPGSLASVVPQRQNARAA